jgi:hypothetical protein
MMGRCRCTAWNSSRCTATGFGPDRYPLMGHLLGGAGRILLRLSVELHQKGQECARQRLRHVVLRPEGIADPGSDGPVAEAVREIVGSLKRAQILSYSGVTYVSCDRLIARIAGRWHVACSMVVRFFFVFDLGEQTAAQLPLICLPLRCNRGCAGGAVLVKVPSSLGQSLHENGPPYVQFQAHKYLFQE